MKISIKKPMRVALLGLALNTNAMAAGEIPVGFQMECNDGTFAYNQLTLK